MKSTKYSLLALLALAACGDGSSLNPDVFEAIETPLGEKSICNTPTDGCDLGQSLPCASLASTWASGTATCRPKCIGYDVSACVPSPALGQSHPSQPTWQRAEVVEPATRDPRWQAARCNNGSPFDFKVRLAFDNAGVQSKDWVIYLEGGGMCVDGMRGCKARALSSPKHLMCSLPEDDRQAGWIKKTGMLGIDPVENPTFHNANHVYAHYCSSDIWSGKRATTVPTSASTYDAQAPGITGMDWYFSGKHNARALIQALIQRYGLDDFDPDTKVALAGSSAGAHGVMHNARMVARHLPRAARNGRLRLISDAGFLQEFAGYNGVASFAGDNVAMATLARGFWGAGFDKKCEQAQIDVGRDPSRCLFGEVVYPFIGAYVPLLVQQGQRDTVYGPMHHIYSSSAREQAWVSAVIASVGTAAWAFSGPDVYHSISKADSKWHYGPPASWTPPQGQANYPSYEFRDVLTRFWLDDVDNPSPEQIIWQ